MGGGVEIMHAIPRQCLAHISALCLSGLFKDLKESGGDGWAERTESPFCHSLLSSVSPSHVKVTRLYSPGAGMRFEGMFPPEMLGHTWSHTLA